MIIDTWFNHIDERSNESEIGEKKTAKKQNGEFVVFNFSGHDIEVVSLLRWPCLFFAMFTSAYSFLIAHGVSLDGFIYQMV